MSLQSASNSRGSGVAETGATRTGRGLELGMLLFAVITVTAADAVVDLNTSNHVGTDVITYGAGYALLWLAAHIVVRILAPYADPLLLPCVALLNGLGLVLIRRLDLAAAVKARQNGNPVPSSDASVQIVQAAVCNRFHSVSQRLCRVLLATGECLHSDSLTLTHESIAKVLANSRGSIGQAAKDLQKRGLIAYHRGDLRILDRKGLERGSCECHRIIGDCRKRALGLD